jgi:hypothetical protein
MQADPEYILRFRSDDAKRVLSSLAATASGSALQVLEGVVATATCGSKVCKALQLVHVKSLAIAAACALCCQL